MAKEGTKIFYLPLPLTLSRSLADMGYTTIELIEANLADLSTRLSPRKLNALIEALGEYHEIENGRAEPSEEYLEPSSPESVSKPIEYLEPSSPESVSKAIEDLGYPNLSGALKEESFRSELVRLTPNLMNQLAFPYRLQNSLRGRNVENFFSCTVCLQSTGVAKLLRDTLESELASLISVLAFRADTYLANHFDISLVPAVSPEFMDSRLEALQLAIKVFLDSCDPNTQHVLKSRAFQQNPDSFMTLEAVAEDLGVTRERIRQIEKKGLVIAHELFFEDGLNRKRKLLVRTEFTSLMQPLIEALRARTEISLADLSDMVESTMNVKSDNLFRFMGLLVPILSGTASGELASASRQQLDSRPLKNIPSKILNSSVSQLRLGRITESLLDRDILTIADFHREFTRQKLVKTDPRRQALRQLMQMDRRWNDVEGDSDYKFAQGLDLYIPEFEWGEGVSETFKGFIPWFKTCISKALSWDDVEPVFRLRTSLPASKRMTMAVLASSTEIKTIQSSGVGRIERYILDHLTLFFVHGDLSKCKVFIPDRVFSLFEKLKPIASEANGDFQLFQTIVSYRFDMHEAEVKQSAHLFWALLTGNLPNRFWHLTQKGEKRKAQPSVGLGIVKLRGFRSRY
jgi:hypothetical protein